MPRGRNSRRRSLVGGASVALSTIVGVGVAAAWVRDGDALRWIERTALGVCVGNTVHVVVVEVPVAAGVARGPKSVAAISALESIDMSAVGSETSRVIVSPSASVVVTSPMMVGVGTATIIVVVSPSFRVVVTVAIGVGSGTDKVSVSPSASVVVMEATEVANGTVKTVASPF